MGHIYFDWTSASNWQGHPTGIARVISHTGLLLNSFENNITHIALSDEKMFLHYEPYENITTEEVSFSKSDLVVGFGANWDIDGYNKVIKNIKQKGVLYSCLIYDIIPLKYPYTYGPGFSSIYKSWLLDTISIADHLFAISENTKTDVEELMPSIKNYRCNLDVIRLGDEIEKVAKNNDVKSEILNLSPFILTVGTIEYRKNHITLINAYRLLVSEGNMDLPALVIVGRPGWLDNSLAYQIENDPSIHNLVHVYSDVSDDDLDYLYRNCLFTVYPSIYEGWGLPVAESLRYGKQCITSNSSSMLEIAPELTRFAHPLKVEEWARSIYELTNDPDMLARENSKVSESYLGTTWEQCANEILVSLKAIGSV